MMNARAVVITWLRSRVAVLVAALALAAPPVHAQEVKSLDWTAFSVDARLDSTGTLRVRERQTILFTGDWNGGERIFDLRDGQRFTFRRMFRVDSATSAEIPMIEGALDDVDGYKFTGRRTLRWRSRKPGDPLFLNTKITYVLEYEYADILVADGQSYRLDHEFAFRDRAGTIANFDLTLQVDQAWRTPDGFTGTFRQSVLEPGISYVVNIPLRFRAAGVPSAVRRSPPVAPRLGLAAAVVLALVAMTITFLRDEAAVGRFEPLTPIEGIDRAWLEAHVFSLSPELVGYAWDESVGAPEVSAVLARLVTEKKLASRVESTGSGWFRRDVLHLELLVPRREFEAYERTLVEAFFRSGATTTSTDDIRARYKSSGFDPASLIRRPLEEQFRHQHGMASTTSPAMRRWPITLALGIAGVALLVLAMVTRSADAAVAAVAVALGVAVFLFTRLQSYLWRRRVVRPAPHLTRVLLPMALLATALCWLLATGYGMLGLFALAGLSVLLVTAHRSVLNGARSTSTRERLLKRKELASAREYCLAELRKPAPALDDAWFPYLLAFGLGNNVEKWFKAFGGAASVRSRSGFGSSGSSYSASESGSGSGGGGGFSGFGGGGGFGGAGATVAFGSAVGAMASGVSAPSSSSSGGGSSSSGGSSGGGGGGGW